MVFLFFVGSNGPAKASIVGELSKCVDAFTENFPPEEFEQIASETNATIRNPDFYEKCNTKEIKKIKKETKKFFKKTLKEVRLRNPSLYRALMKTVNVALPKIRVRFGGLSGSSKSYAEGSKGTKPGKIFVSYFNEENCLEVMIHEVAHPIGDRLRGARRKEERFYNSQEDVPLFFELLSLIKYRTDFGLIGYARAAKLFMNIVLASTLCDIFGDTDSLRISDGTLVVIVEGEDRVELERLNDAAAVDRLAAEADRLAAKADRLDAEADGLRLDAGNLRTDADTLMANGFGSDIDGVLTKLDRLNELSREESRLIMEANRLRLEAANLRDRSRKLREKVDEWRSLNEVDQKTRDKLEVLRETFQWLVRNPRAFLKKDPKFGRYVKKIPRGDLLWKHFSMFNFPMFIRSMGSIDKGGRIGLKKDDRGDFFIEFLHEKEIWHLQENDIFVETFRDPRENLIFGEHEISLLNAVSLLESGRSMNRTLSKLKNPHRNAITPENVKNTCTFLLDLFSKSR